MHFESPAVKNFPNEITGIQEPGVRDTLWKAGVVLWRSPFQTPISPSMDCVGQLVQRFSGSRHTVVKSPKLRWDYISL